MNLSQANGLPKREKDKLIVRHPSPAQILSKIRKWANHDQAQIPSRKHKNAKKAGRKVGILISVSCFRSFVLS
jgi:hypothetical protein